MEKSCVVAVIPRSVVVSLAGLVSIAQSLRYSFTDPREVDTHSLDVRDNYCATKQAH